MFFRIYVNFLLKTKKIVYIFWILNFFLTNYFIRDADDAIRGRDGYEFGGERLRVEIPAPRGSRGRGGGGGGGRMGGFSGRGGRGERGG